MVETISELPFIKFNKHDLVLHIGCGRGKQLQYLTSKYESICVGIDIVPFKISNFIVSDVCYLPFRNEIFDIVFSLGVIEHTKETEKAVTESRKVLRNRGQCLHSVPNMFSLHTFLERPLTNILFKKWSVGFEQSFTSKKIMNMFYENDFIAINLETMSKSIGKSKIYQLNQIESLFYLFIKEMDRFLSKIIPYWGFFLSIYARADESSL